MRTWVAKAMAQETEPQMVGPENRAMIHETAKAAATGSNDRAMLQAKLCPRAVC
jgi:hypothetical protein